MTARPLDGVRVLEFAQLFPGPYVGLVLAAFGAEVIKVEPPSGDAARMMPPYVQGSGGDAGAVFCAVNRGKKSVVLDLKQEAGVADYHRLARTCRIVVDGFRPGVAERLGVGFDSLAAGRDDLLYLALTGFGPTGSLAGEPGHDLTYQAWMGALDPASKRPPALPAADTSGALWAATLVLAHLGAPGNHKLEASLAGALRAPLFLGAAVAATGDGTNPVRDGLPGYAIYPCKDGAAIAIGALEPHFWEAFCRVLGDDALAVAGHPAREHDPDVYQRVAAHLGTDTREAWLDRLRAAGVPAAPVRSFEEAFADPADVRSWDPPSVQGDEDLAGAPALGEHTDRVLSALE